MISAMSWYHHFLSGLLYAKPLATGVFLTVAFMFSKVSNDSAKSFVIFSTFDSKLLICSSFCASFSSNDFEIRLALLLHDIGKPYCFYEECGVRHFHGHGDVSADMSYDILTRLGFEKDFIFRVCEIIRYHDVTLTEEDIIKDYDLSKIKFNVQICDALAHNPEKNAKRLAYIEKTNELFKNIKILNNRNL